MATSNDGRNSEPIVMDKDRVVVVMVPLAAQGHLNQLLQLSCIISSYNLPVHYIGFATHNRQAKHRANGLDPDDLSKIHFHDFPTPDFPAPPPDPNLPSKFPVQLQPAWDAALSLREPVTKYLQELALKVKRVIIIHDPLMAYVVQDANSIPNSESYSFNCISAFFQASYIWEEEIGKPLPIEHPENLPSFEDCMSDDIKKFAALQNEGLNARSGELHNTSRLIEGPYADLISIEELVGNKKVWFIGPILATRLSLTPKPDKCLAWLDKQPPKSVIYVSFGTTTSLSDEEVKELARGLEQSKQKFIWVLRDADKADVFDGKVKKIDLPEGFEERVEGRGIIIRDWAPQVEILAHKSTGGFMSHCGWNSCLESLTMGVPIVAWPMHSDQPRNAVLITEILKVGVLMRDWARRKEVVKAETVKDVVTRLMDSEEGQKIRKRAEDLATAISLESKEGGVTKAELDSFVSHITRQAENGLKPESSVQNSTELKA